MTQIGPTTCDTCGIMKPPISEWKDFQTWMNLCVTGDLIRDFCSFECLRAFLCAQRMGANEPVAEKPPLGLRPRYVVAWERIIEITNAIDCYVNAGRNLPSDWLGELSELYGYLAEYRDEQTR